MLKGIIFICKFKGFQAIKVKTNPVNFKTKIKKRSGDYLPKCAISK